MKIAFDVHGVLDTYEYFRNLLKLHISNGDTVYIISGQLLDEQMSGFLTEYSLSYHHYFSIVEEVQKLGIDIDWTSGLPVVDDKVWDPIKSNLCEKHSIDILYDDSPVYKDTFNHIDTLYVHIVNPNRKQYKTR